MRVMIDPGHTGETDPGAVSGGLREADVNLDVALRLLDKLTGLNALDVRLTRVKHGDLSKPFSQVADLTARSSMANAWPADLFLSIHCNAATSTAAHGYETYVHDSASAESRRVGRIIHGHLAPLFRADRGLKTANFHVLRETRMPAVLVEMGFVTNEQDREQLQTASFRQQLADALYAAILEAYPAVRPSPPGNGAPGTPVPDGDWKERALAAEAELRRVRDEIMAILTRVK